MNQSFLAVVADPATGLMDAVECEETKEGLEPVDGYGLTFRLNTEDSVDEGWLRDGVHMMKNAPGVLIGIHLHLEESEEYRKEAGWKDVKIAVDGYLCCGYMLFVALNPIGGDFVNISLDQLVWLCDNTQGISDIEIPEWTQTCPGYGLCHD